MKRTKTTLEGELLFFKSKISVFKESDNTYYFESNNDKLTYFITDDYMEAVSALMKLKDVMDFEDLWDIEITNKMRENVNIEKSLYWITGGDREWVKNKTYKKTWKELSNTFTKKYSRKLNSINNNSKTLGDVRDELLKYMSLPIIYEFALNEDMI
jgi:hypothetical protein